VYDTNEEQQGNCVCCTHGRIALFNKCSRWDTKQ
jgi:hypothetical protein